MKAIFALLDPAQWIITAVIFLGVVIGGNFLWKHVEGIGYAKAVDVYAKQAKAADEKRDAVAPVVEAKHQEEVAKIVTVTKIILKEVPVYVKDTDCPMSGGFRLLHDAAANGEVPDPAGIPDAAPAPAQDVASTVADNYGTCRVIRQTLIDFQDWAHRQQVLKE